MDTGREPGSAQSVLQTVQTIEYHYSAPAREVVNWLRLFPRVKRGAQRLLSRECQVWPQPDRMRRFADEFGNEIWEFLHQEVTDRLRFSLDLVTAHGVNGRPGGSPVGRLVASHGVP